MKFSLFLFLQRHWNNPDWMRRAISGVRLIRTTATSPALSTQCSGPKGPGQGGARAAAAAAVFQEGYNRIWRKKKNEIPSWNYLEVFCNPHTLKQSAVAFSDDPRNRVAHGQFLTHTIPLIGAWTKKRDGEIHGWVCYNLHSSWNVLGSENALEIKKFKTSW